MLVQLYLALGEAQSSASSESYQAQSPPLLAPHGPAYASVGPTHLFPSLTNMEEME